MKEPFEPVSVYSLHSFQKVGNKKTLAENCTKPNCVVKTRYLNKIKQNKTTIICLNNTEKYMHDKFNYHVCMCALYVYIVWVCLLWPLLFTWFTMCQWFRAFLYFLFDQNIKNPFEHKYTAWLFRWKFVDTNLFGGVDVVASFLLRHHKAKSRFSFRLN